MDTFTVSKNYLEAEYESYKDHILLLLSKQKLECANEYYELVKKAQSIDDLVCLFRTGILPILLLYTDAEPSFDISGVNFKVDLKSLNSTLSKRETEEAMDPDETKNVFNATNNLNIFINAAKSLNIVVVNVSSEDLLQGKNGDLVFGLTWQMIRRAIFRDVSIDRHPELLRLLRKNEKVSSFMSIPDEDMILRWANKHLKDAGCPQISKSKTIGQTLKEGTLLMKILDQVVPESRESEKKRIKASFGSPNCIQEFLDVCRSLDIDIAFTVRDLLTGDLKVYILILASIFNKYTGLYLLSEEESKAIFCENDVLKARTSQLESKLESLLNDISETKLSLSAITAEKQAMEISQRELQDKMDKEIESLKAELGNKESWEKNFVENVLNIARNVNNESELAFAKVSDEELHAKIKGVLSMSKLNTNFGKQVMCSPNSPDLQSTESLKESCLATKPMPLNKEEVDSKSHEEACIVYLGNASELLSNINNVLVFKDANIAELVLRLEKLVNINVVMTQKIREYTKEFMQQRKR